MKSDGAFHLSRFPFVDRFLHLKMGGSTMRKTKIICTIGPACTNEETIRRMCGMNVARLNFSHGSHEEHLERINLLKKVRRELNLPIAIMLDTKGPEYRIGCFEKGRFHIGSGVARRKVGRQGNSVNNI